MGTEVAEGTYMPADPTMVPHTETKNVSTAPDGEQDGTQQDDIDPYWPQLLEEAQLPGGCGEMEKRSDYERGTRPAILQPVLDSYAGCIQHRLRRVPANYTASIFHLRGPGIDQTEDLWQGIRGGSCNH